MNTQIASCKAIETRYKGYRFRSRLEARWAVFFDALAIRWVYEPEGYELPSGRYLPDFFLYIHPTQLYTLPPGSGYWVEIKPPCDPATAEIILLDELAKGTGHSAYMLCGAPGEWPAYYMTHFRVPGVDRIRIDFQCPFERGPVPIAPVCLGVENESNIQVLGWSALAQARSARFEFGESGPV